VFAYVLALFRKKGLSTRPSISRWSTSALLYSNKILRDDGTVGHGKVTRMQMNLMGQKGS